MKIKGLILAGIFLATELSVAKDYPAEPVFESVPVLEDITATWCGWCPLATIITGRYSDIYNGENGTRKVISIAVHDTDYLQIEDEVSDYRSAFTAAMGSYSYPSLYLNRNRGRFISATNPRSAGLTIEAALAQPAYCKVEVDTPGFDEKSGMVNVGYKIQSVFNPAESPLNVSLIVTEDTVRHSTSGYDQTSYLRKNGYTKEYVIQNFGEEWVLWFDPYFLYQTVTTKRVPHQHVARVAVPDYRGVPLPAAEPFEEIEGEFEFSLPTNVMIPQHVNLIVLVTDADTGDILAANQTRLFLTLEPPEDSDSDNSDSDNSDSEAAISSISGFGLRITGDSLAGCLPLPAMIQTITPDGRLLSSIELPAGNVSIPLPDQKGIILLKITTAESSQTLRICL